METIWKFKLEVTGKQLIEVPTGAIALSVQTQNNDPCIWALVNPSNPKENRAIEIFGTGNPIRQGERSFIGTFQLSNGLVFHVFENILNERIKD